MSHVQTYLDAHQDIDVAVHYVWLPMFPRPAEKNALPEIAGKYAGKSVTQYWDDTKAVGAYAKAQLIPEFRGDIVWDAFLLFDGEATWENAGDHLLGWGFTVEAKREKLFELLNETAAAPAF